MPHDGFVATRSDTDARDACTGQFLEAQHWALGSAMAVVLVGLILATVAVLALLALGGRAVLRRRRAVVLP